MTETIEFTSTPDGSPTGRTYDVSTLLETDEVTSNGETADVHVSATLSVNGVESSTLEGDGTSGDSFNIDFSHYFGSPGTTNLLVEAEIDYYGIPGYDLGTIDDGAQDFISISLKPASPEQAVDIDGPSEQTFTNSFDDRSETLIDNVTTDEDDELPFDMVDFSPFDNPDVAVDSSARFAVHEIIGGTTVRQKIGEDPTEISLNGVCTEDVAVQVDELRRAKLITLVSDRLAVPLRCQVASTSTDPLESGGAADLDEGDFLYEFSINLVEIEREV